MRKNPIVNLRRPVCYKQCIAGMKSAYLFLKYFLRVALDSADQYFIQHFCIDRYSWVTSVYSFLTVLSLSGSGINDILASYKRN